MEIETNHPDIDGDGDDVVAATALVERWALVFNGGDLDALTALYADGATLLGTSSPLLYEGLAPIRSYFSGRSDVELRALSPQVVGPGAVLIAGFYDFFRPRVERTNRYPARFTFLVVKTGDGWRIRHHHSSALPEQP